VTRTVTLTFDQFAKSRERLAQQFWPTVQRGILSGAMRCIPEMHARTADAPPANPSGIGAGGAVNTGRYKGAWQAVRIDGGARLYNSAPYAGVIEYGARPLGARGPRLQRVVVKGQNARPLSPRMEALKRWVELKLHVSKEESRSVAFLVGRAIARRGLLPRRVMTGEGQIARLTSLVLGEVRHEIDEAIRESYGAVGGSGGGGHGGHH
jgi:hypothetical protein